MLNFAPIFKIGTSHLAIKHMLTATFHKSTLAGSNSVTMTRGTICVCDMEQIASLSVM